MNESNIINIFIINLFIVSFYSIRSTMTIISLFPIGICGMGKSTLCRKIRNFLLSRDDSRDIEVHWIERDAIFQKYREMGYSIRKIKAELRNYYQAIADKIRDSDQRQPDKIFWLLFDTSNIAEDTREKAIQMFRPHKIWNIYLSFPLNYQDNKDQMLDFIRHRVKVRENHPTFPTNSEPEEQEQNVLRLWDSFERYGTISQHFTDADFSLDIERINDVMYLEAHWNIVEKTEDWFDLLFTF